MVLEDPVPEAVPVPCDAAEEMLQVSVSPAFASVACSVRLKAVGDPSSDMVTLVEAPSVITGATFTDVMVTLTVIVSVAVPSETCTTKLSVPT